MPVMRAKFKVRSRAESRHEIRRLFDDKRRFPDAVVTTLVPINVLTNQCEAVAIKECDLVSAEGIRVILFPLAQANSSAPRTIARQIRDAESLDVSCVVAEARKQDLVGPGKEHFCPGEILVVRHFVNDFDTEHTYAKCELVDLAGVGACLARAGLKNLDRTISGVSA